MVNKEEILIEYLKELYKNIKIKAEYSTDDNDVDVIVVQEQPGEKVVFFEDTEPLFNYFQINIYGTSIRQSKYISNQIGNLIGKHVKIKIDKNTWQIIFMQYSNPQPIEYLDIRRIGYTSTMKCIINQIM